MIDLETYCRGDGALLERATVQIVDSCQDSRESTALFFKSLGYRVIEFDSMPAWQRGSSQSPVTGIGILLLTVGHRDASALQFVRSLPALAKRKTPIVIISTVGDERFVAAALRCGAFHVLPMPGTEPELRSVAREALQSSLEARGLSA